MTATPGSTPAAELLPGGRSPVLYSFNFTSISTSIALGVSTHTHVLRLAVNHHLHRRTISPALPHIAAAMPHREVGPAVLYQHTS